MVTVCNVWKSQPTKCAKMLLQWFVLTLTVKKRWLSMCNWNFHDCVHVSMPAPLCFGYLCNWGTHQLWKWIYSLEILPNFYFYGHEKAIKLAKNNKEQRKLTQNCKTLSKVKCIQISYKKYFIWLVIGCVRYIEVSSRG